MQFGTNKVYGFLPYQHYYMHVKNPLGSTTIVQKRDVEAEEKHHNELLEAGFSYNEALNFYYSDDGALMSDSSITLEELKKYPNFKDCDKLGYVLGYGKPTPTAKSLGYKRSIYCQNYEEIIEILKENQDTEMSI